MSRRFKSSRGRSGSSRFRGSKFAKKKLLWVNQLTSVAIFSGAASAALISPSLWVLNASSGNMEHAKVLRLLLTPLLTIGTTHYPGSVLYSLYIDDTSAGGAGDPLTVTYYDEAQPFFQGLLDLPAAAATLLTQQVRSNGFRANQIDIPVNRKVRTDQSLWVSMSSAVNLNSGGTPSFQWLARALVQLD